MERNGNKLWFGKTEIRSFPELNSAVWYVYYYDLLVYATLGSWSSLTQNATDKIV